MTFHPDELWAILPWAVLALVMCVALYFVLGRNIGAQGIKAVTENKKMKMPKIGSSKTIEPPPLPTDLGTSLGRTEFVYPEKDTELGNMLKRLNKELPGFSTESFFKEVETSFKGVLEAFAASDTETLGHWADETVAKGFVSAIKEREKDNLTLNYKLEQIAKLEIADIVEVPATEDVPSAWRVGMDIYSWQMNYVTDAKEEVVQGNASRTFFQDRWFFEASPVATGKKVFWKLVKTEVL